MAWQRVVGGLQVGQELFATLKPPLAIELYNFHSMAEEIKARRYSKISYQKRLKLINLVVEDNFDVRRAANNLRIKVATAKCIVKRFQQDGKILKKKGIINRRAKPAPTEEPRETSLDVPIIPEVIHKAQEVEQEKEEVQTPPMMWLWMPQMPFNPWGYCA